MTHAAAKLTPEQLEAFGQEMDAIRQRVIADLGERDADYIRRIIAVQRALEVTGRGLFFVGFLPPAWLGAVAALSLSKILENMEIGHNVMHGQYDWMADPALNGKKFEWDNVCPSDNWRYEHNYKHHTFTNVYGKDRDVGYGILRITDLQPWHPYYLGNPIYGALLILLFEWGVMGHDLQIDRIVKGEISWADTAVERRKMLPKIGRQVLKDYVVFPALTGPLAPLTFAGNFTANIVRNIWSGSIIFCGHFPDGTVNMTVEETENESRGHWYYRQLLGAANLSGNTVFHILSGNLSFQIEHHLFPDLPASRYAEISLEVQDICKRYDLPYNVGPLHHQFGTVFRKLFKLALPDRKNAAPVPSKAQVEQPEPVLVAA